jgi:hypothetical protein
LYFRLLFLGNFSSVARSRAIMKNRPCILVLTGCYLPGFRGGGPLRTIFNAVSSLHGDFDFHILTADRDLGDAAPYPGIGGAVWHTVGHARVRYLSPAEQRPADLWRVIAQTDHRTRLLITGGTGSFGNDLFFLPTRGENFGHVIAEALSVGTPVLIRRARALPANPIRRDPHLQPRREEAGRHAQALCNAKLKFYIGDVRDRDSVARCAARGGLRVPRRGAEAGAVVRVLPDGGGAHQRAGRRERAAAAIAAGVRRWSC